MGYEHRGDRNTLTTYGRFDASRTTLDAYREHGLGIYDLDYREQTVDSRTVAVGLEGSYARSWAHCTWMPAGMPQRSLSIVRLSRIWLPSVPSILQTPSRFCRSACKPTVTNPRRISSLAPRAQRMRPPLPPWF